MVFTCYTKQRILYYYLHGRRAPTIAKLIREGVEVSRVGVAKFLAKFKETGCISRTPGSGRPLKLTGEIKTVVDEKKREDDETTAFQFHELLVASGFKISLRTVLRCQTSLGWTFRGSSYCQLIHTVNKAKRLQWDQHHLRDNFENVVWTDECTVQLETHRRFCCRKRGEPPRVKPRYTITYMYILCIFSRVQCVLKLCFFTGPSIQ